MKKAFLLLALIAANVAIYAQYKKADCYQLEITMQTVESLSHDENEDVHCISGGPNSVSCSIKGEFEEFSGECSVTCNENSYACCSIKGCHCI